MTEHNRSSLVDDSFSSVGAGKKATKVSGGGSGNTVKLVLVVACLAIASVLIAFQMGYIPNPFEEKAKPTIRTQEDNKAVQDYQKQIETSKTKPNVVQGGS